MKLGIVCYPTVGGSGAVAAELGKQLAGRGHEVHVISYRLPFRFGDFHQNICFHEVDVSAYPLFDYPPHVLALAWLLDRYAPLWSLELPLLGILGRGITLLGLAMILWPVMQFLLAHTGLVPFSKATTLVTTGLYRLTRNPMYLGMVLILLGAALVFGSLGALLPLPLFVIIIQRRFILGEERFLEATFGNEYRAYRQRVRRWI